MDRFWQRVSFASMSVHRQSGPDVLYLAGADEELSLRRLGGPGCALLLVHLLPAFLERRATALSLAL